MFIAVLFMLVLLTNVKPPERRGGVNSANSTLPNGHTYSHTGQCVGPDMYVDFWGRCRHTQPTNASSEDVQHRSSGIFVAFSILMLIQFMAVCVVVFIRRRALQRAHAFEGVTVHRTRDGWLSLENDSDSDNEQADNQVGLPSYDEICRDEGPPSYDAVPGATGAQARPSSPPPPMSPRESSATTTASPRVSSTLGL